MDKFDLKTKCHCLSCFWEGTYEDLVCEQFNRGEPQCPECNSDDIVDGYYSARIDLVEASRELLEEIRDWLSQPQTTGGRFPMETNRAESEGVEDMLCEIINVLEGSNP